MGVRQADGMVRSDIATFELTVQQTACRGVAGAEVARREDATTAGPCSAVQLVGHVILVGAGAVVLCGGRAGIQVGPMKGADQS